MRGLAATRLIAMHINKGKTIAQCLKDRTDYAKNDEKTENGEYVSSYACNVEIADKEFAESKREYFQLTGRKPKGDITAYQIRQSFKPGEITPEEANRIGYETALRFTKGNHAFIVATHTDKAHIHNHIIFNSTNLACDRKFRDSWFIALALQRLSDLICLENGLSVIKPRKPGERIKRTEYPDKKTFRSGICEAIDAALVQKPETFGEFLKILMEQDFEIKSGKNLAIKGKDQKRFIRFKSLGDGYSESDIRKIIEGEAEQAQERKENAKHWQPKKKKLDLLIDIQEKLHQGKGAGYTRWATVYNIKQISQALLFLEEHDVRDYATLADRASLAATRFSELSQKIKSLEKRLGEIAVLKTHIINYSKTKDVYVAYRKAGYSKKFFEVHREEITLHKAAKQAFSEQEGKIPRVKELNAEYAEVLAEKKKAYAEYCEAKKDMQDYLTAKHNIDAFLNVDQSAEQEQKKEKEKESTR